MNPQITQQMKLMDQKQTLGPRAVISQAGTWAGEGIRASQTLHYQAEEEDRSAPRVRAPQI